MLGDRILAARTRLSSLLAEQNLEDLVEPYDPEKYNDNASLAENLLFGTVVSDKLNVDALGDHAYVLATIKAVGLTEDLLGIGRETAALMLELFADVEPGDALFEQYSFIKAEDLPEYQIIVAKFDRGGAEALNDRERSMLLTLPFKLIPARHRLGLITDEIRERIIEARTHFRENMPEDLRGAVEFFDPAEFNAVASVQDNILFGKIAYGQAEGPETVGRLIDETLDELGLRQDIVGAGLEFQVGIGGSRLSGTQRQKIAIARALAKQPDILILNAATDGMDTRTRHALVDRVLSAAPGGVVWAVGDAEHLKGFDRAAEVAGGKVVNVKTLASAAAEPAS